MMSVKFHRERTV